MYWGHITQFLEAAFLSQALKVLWEMLDNAEGAAEPRGSESGG